MPRTLRAVIRVKVSHKEVESVIHPNIIRVSNCEISFFVVEIGGAVFTTVVEFSILVEAHCLTHKQVQVEVVLD